MRHCPVRPSSGLHFLPEYIIRGVDTKVDTGISCGGRAGRLEVRRPGPHEIIPYEARLRRKATCCHQ